MLRATRSIVLLLLLALASTSAAAEQLNLRATFVSSTTAAITWDQPPDIPMTCLLRYYGAAWPAGICWENLPAGATRVDLPGIYSHPAYRPAWGDRYELRFGDTLVASTYLGEAHIYQQYLALLRRDTASALQQLWLPDMRH